MIIPKDIHPLRAAEQSLGLLHHELGAEERSEIRTRSIYGSHCWRPAFFTDVGEAVRYAINLAETNEVYASVAVRRGEDGTKKGVCRMAALWADLDAKGSHTRESRWLQLAGLPCPPSMVVWSGGGFHAYWPLQEPARSPEEMERAELVMRLLATGLGSDPVHDRSRILRVPGTFNHKIPGEPRPVALEVFEPERRYSLDRLQQMAESLPGVTDAGADGTAGAGGVRREVLDRPIPQHHRNTSLASVAGSLRDRGLDAETIRVTLLVVNRLRCTPALPDEEVSRIARSISRYPAGQPRYKRSPVRRVRKKKEK